MDRNDTLNQKRQEILELLEQWAQEEGILGSGERIQFSLRIETIPVVVDFSAQNTDFAEYPVQDFFTPERAKQANVNINLQGINAICNALHRAHINSIGELLGHVGRVRNLGLQRLLCIQKMLETAGLSLNEKDLDRVRKMSEGPISRTSIPTQILHAPLLTPLHEVRIGDFFTKKRAELAGIGVVRNTGPELSLIVACLTGYTASGHRSTTHAPSPALKTMADVTACTPQKINKMLGPGKLANALFHAMLESAELRLREEKF